ncbi:MAG: hypothetical protein KKH85_02725 [Proteobacteria bacterium]|nr:hypothetical protein [Pseudomonadota bacterium]
MGEERGNTFIMLLKEQRKGDCGNAINSIGSGNSGGSYAGRPSESECLWKKMIGKPYSGKPNVRLCVQRRLVCSAGVSPAGVKVRSPVAWIAGWRETKTLKPTDKATERVVASHRAVAKVNAEVASKIRKPWRSST